MKRIDQYLYGIRSMLLGTANKSSDPNDTIIADFDHFDAKIRGFLADNTEAQTEGVNAGMIPVDVGTESEWWAAAEILTGTWVRGSEEMESHAVPEDFDPDDPDDNNDTWTFEPHECMWNTLQRFESHLIDLQIAGRVGLGVVESDGERYLFLRSCGMDLTPEFLAYQALALGGIDFSEIDYFHSHLEWCSTVLPRDVFADMCRALGVADTPAVRALLKSE